MILLPPASPVPDWTAGARSFLSITRTPDELSIVADLAAVPPELRPHSGLLALRVRGPLQLDLVGIFAALAGPLAAAGIPVFPIATHNTDYLLVPEIDAGAAAAALAAAGHEVSKSGVSF